MIWPSRIFFKHLNVVIILLLFLTTLYLLYSLYIIQSLIETQQNTFTDLLLEINQIKQKIVILEQSIKELQTNIPPVLPEPNLWWFKSINFICLGCILTTFIGSKIFFAYTPYMLNYTAKSWSFSVISYFYPVIWTKDQAPKIFRDSIDNLFSLIVDTDLDIFVFHAQLVGTKKAITIAEFIQWVLNLS